MELETKERCKSCLTLEISFQNPLSFILSERFLKKYTNIILERSLQNILIFFSTYNKTFRESIKI